MKQDSFFENIRYLCPEHVCLEAGREFHVFFALYSYIAPLFYMGGTAQCSLNVGSLGTVSSIILILEGVMLLKCVSFDNSPGASSNPII